jgi:hypothetical protein
MLRNFAQRFFEQLFARRKFVPGRCARWMRQRDKIDISFSTLDLKLASDDLIEFFERNELRDREAADRNQETRLQDFHFVIHPRRAVANLIRRGHAIATARSFPGKASTNGREIYCRSNHRFIHSAEFFEPAEKSFTGSMSEWSFQNRLADTGRLSDENDVANGGAARNRRRQHARATPALHKARNMIIQPRLL